MARESRNRPDELRAEALQSLPPSTPLRAATAQSPAGGGGHRCAHAPSANSRSLSPLPPPATVRMRKPLRRAAPALPAPRMRRRRAAPALGAGPAPPQPLLPSRRSFLR